jgi:hypothetical protein
MNTDSLADFAGFAGAFIILAGFAWNTWRNAAPDIVYHLCNLVGAGLLAFSLSIHFNLPALLLELAWAVIAAAGLVRMALRR